MNLSKQNQIYKNIYNVNAQINEACSDAKRSLNDVTLIAVSKNHNEHNIQIAIDNKIINFGENRVQEAYKKWTKIIKNNKATLHLIGPLQTNKTNQAIKLFQYIHSLDRPTLAEAIAKSQDKLKIFPNVLIQINTGKETQKSGIIIDNFHQLFSLSQKLQINVKGVMCIPPINQDPIPHFKDCRLIAEEYNLPLKSFGMSTDFKVAIKQGATHIRVGNAIFGKRT